MWYEELKVWIMTLSGVQQGKGSMIQDRAKTTILIFRKFHQKSIQRGSINHKQINEYKNSQEKQNNIIKIRNEVRIYGFNFKPQIRK